MGKYAKKGGGEVTKKGGIGNILKRKIDLQNIAKIYIYKQHKNLLNF